MRCVQVLYLYILLIVLIFIAAVSFLPSLYQLLLLLGVQPPTAPRPWPLVLLQIEYFQHLFRNTKFLNMISFLKFFNFFMS